MYVYLIIYMIIKKSGIVEEKEAVVRNLNIDVQRRPVDSPCLGNHALVQESVKANELDDCETKVILWVDSLGEGRHWVRIKKVTLG